ncbi:MAG: hypothetical protein KDD53_06290 [Bdellovibrionales bacterium]|nr:hypothetical protein [Bdellovibrionales bacterium]
MKNVNKKPERGYILIGVLILTALSLIVASGMLASSSTNTKTRVLVNTQANNYYEVEATLNNVVAWLQTNSKSLVTAFNSANFNSNFDIGSPSLGDNEGEHFGVPTMVKIAGTNNSVMLTNNDFFGTPAFPSTSHIDSGASFNPITEFQNADLGSANARVILIWARETGGNYEPIFRVDVVTGNNPDRGVHAFSYVFSTLESSTVSLGFYGKTHLTTGTGNNCFSYLYTHNGVSWSKGAQRSNCPVASDNTITLKSQINGTAASLLDPGIVLSNPGGNVSGDQCEGPGCHSYVFDPVNTWDGYCAASNHGDLNVNPSVTLPTGGCWRDVSIPNNKTLTLTDTVNPYYFRTLSFSANNAKFDFGNIPPGQKVTIYMEKTGNDHMNGNEYYNPNNAPHQVEVIYIGTDTFKMNGNADFNAVVISPNADIDVQGNFNFYGGIFAKSIDVSGNALFNYDEGIGGTPVLSDMNFAVKKASQRYR